MKNSKEHIIFHKEFVVPASADSLFDGLNTYTSAIAVSLFIDRRQSHNS